MILRMYKDIDVTPSDDILTKSMLYDGYVKLKNDPNLYKMLSFDKNTININFNNKEITIDYSDVEFIQQKASRCIYVTDFSYLPGNDFINVPETLICKNNRNIDGSIINLTIGATYSITSMVKNNIDKRVKVGVKSNDGATINIDYEYFFKTPDEIRNDKLNSIFI